jgi:hypothetical protein
MCVCVVPPFWTVLSRSVYDRGVLFHARAIRTGGIFVGSVFIDGILNPYGAFPRLRRSVAVLLRRRPGFAPWPACVWLMVEEMTRGRGCLRVLRLSPFSIILPEFTVFILSFDHSFIYSFIILEIYIFMDRTRLNQCYYFTCVFWRPFDFRANF